MDLILTAIIYSILVLSINIFVAIPFSSWVAVRAGAIDLPGEIKVHSTPTPRLGGLGILLTFLLAVSALTMNFDFSSIALHRLVVLMTLLICLGVVGFLDDVHNLSPLLRFIVEGVIGIVLTVSILGANISWPLLIVSWFWIVGLINAYNFLDGLDGLAASVATANLIALGIVFFISGNSLFALVAGTMALATCGFLRFNWPPASIFMGDIGSLSLGFIISALSLILVANESFSTNSMLAVVLAAILPLGDLTATVFRRFLSGKPLFQGDRGHFYDVLVDRFGFTKSQVVYFSLIMALVVGSLSILIFKM